MLASSRLLLTSSLLVFAAGCTDGRATCIPGRLGCECAPAGCGAGLACVDGLCAYDDELPCGGVCAPDEVCSLDACVRLPATCPCPLESYCHFDTNTCRAGCTLDDDCAPGRICEASRALCRAGCRDDADCAAGSICEATRCAVGCRGDGDCGAGSICEDGECRAGCRSSEACGAGEACVDGSCLRGCASSAACPERGSVCDRGVCRCPRGQTVCGGACVAIDTVERCGACDRSCGPGESCEAGRCTCPPGECDVQLLVEGGPSVRHLVVHDGLVDYLLAGTIYRIAADGSSPPRALLDGVTSFDVGPTSVLAAIRNRDLVVLEDGAPRVVRASVTHPDSGTGTVRVGEQWAVVSLPSQRVAPVVAYSLDGRTSYQLSQHAGSIGVIRGADTVYYLQGTSEPSDVRGGLQAWEARESPPRLSNLGDLPVGTARDLPLIVSSFAYVGVVAGTYRMARHGSSRTTIRASLRAAAADSSGLVWVSERGIEHVPVASAQSTLLYPWTASIAQVALDQDGFVYWLEPSTGRIWRRRLPR